MRPILLVVPHGSSRPPHTKPASAMPMRCGHDSPAVNDGIPFARALPETAVRDPVNKSSTDLQQELRDILDKTEIGHLTPPEQTAEGIQMFAVCSKKESKSDSPETKENARSTVRAKIRRPGPNVIMRICAVRP